MLGGCCHPGLEPTRRRGLFWSAFRRRVVFPVHASCLLAWGCMAMLSPRVCAQWCTYCLWCSPLCMHCVHADSVEPTRPYGRCSGSRHFRRSMRSCTLSRVPKKSPSASLRFGSDRLNFLGFAHSPAGIPSIVGVRRPTSGWRSTGCQASPAGPPVFRESSALRRPLSPASVAPLPDLRKLFPHLLGGRVGVEEETDPETEELSLLNPVSNNIIIKYVAAVRKLTLRGVSPKRLNS